MQNIPGPFSIKYFQCQILRDLHKTPFAIMNLDLPFDNFDRFVYNHLAAGYQPESWVMANFLRFTPETPEDEIEVDGDSVKLSGRPSICLLIYIVK